VDGTVSVIYVITTITTTIMEILIFLWRQLPGPGYGVWTKGRALDPSGTNGATGQRLTGSTTVLGNGNWWKLLKTHRTLFSRMQTHTGNDSGDHAANGRGVSPNNKYSSAPSHLLSQIQLFGRR
jgi:hypothetical protein